MYFEKLFINKNNEKINLNLIHRRVLNTSIDISENDEE